MGYSRRVISFDMVRAGLACLAIILVGGVLGGFPGHVQASGGEGFSLSPLSFEAVLEAGGQDAVRMVIRNVGSGDLNLRLYACDVLVRNSETGSVEYVNADEPGAAVSPWFTMEPAELFLSSNEEQSVTVTLEVPANAWGGSYRGVVFAETVPDSGGAAQVGNRIGMLTFVSVGDSEGPSLTVTDVRVRNGWLPKPYLEVTVVNPGHVHQRLRGQVKIQGNSQDKTVLELPRVILQPDEVRTVRVFWPQPPRWGRFAGAVQMQMENHLILETEFAFILFPAASAVGLILLVLAIGLLRSRPGDPLSRIRKPGR